MKGNFLSIFLSKNSHYFTFLVRWQRW